MSLWTKAALGAAVVAVCASGAAAQAPAAGCATCNTKSLAPGVPYTIPKCNKHDGLTQYPLSEKRYIKQFCGPTICPNSCFGHFKTQWTAWPQACPGWPAEGVDPANFGPNFTRFEPPVTAEPKLPAPAAAAPTAPAVPDPKPLDPVPPAPPSKPLELPPSKPASSTPLPMPQVPSVPPAGGVKLPDLPPAGNPGGRF